ncbi:alkaline phosphatase family protein [Acididesulfobacillus acetoxydans]|uniref:alkaline phosphatase family protein n=1 Tax=Acididesulfobacillus acetoxydans TaxID=1561005 RepID=UPI001F0D6048|nr:alkaline phosphatase family protein [Acididesulfobacillus acetoxydans]
MKKLILFVIDSLHPVILGRTLSEGNAPALRFLARNGEYFQKVVSCFPTMTPVAMSSIITGRPPDQHEVPGFIWYNEKISQIVDYGATWQSLLKLGPDRVIRNLLKRLNEEHLSPEISTLYEKLEEKGLTTGNINFFIHRGVQEYITRIPLLMSLATGFRLYKEKVCGPKVLTLGSLTHPVLGKRPFFPHNGIFHRFGFNDIYSGRMASQIIEAGQQPDFLMVYFPDNDKHSHQKGPWRTGASIERADRQVAAVLNALGPWEKALEENVIIVTGDHAQTTVGLGNEYLIDLDRALRPFKRLKATEKEEDKTKEIAICPNERMAFIYILGQRKRVLPQLLEILARDPRNAQIAWKTRHKQYAVLQGGTEKRLHFYPGGPYRDVYGQTWGFEGKLEVVDAQLGPDGVLTFGQYPDAFSRLSSSLEARKGSRIVLSARSGYEYFAEGGPIHPGGGSHGSLEQEDSIVPMIIAGTGQTLENPRITDLYGFIVKHFGFAGTN